MVSIGTDLSNLILQHTLTDASKGLNSAIKSMTTGYKINNARDDAAGYAVASKMEVMISSWLVAHDNAENSLSLLDTAERGLSNIYDILNRLRDLSVQAADGVYDDDSRKAMQEEADQLIEQIKQIKANTDYNGLKVLGSESKNGGAATFSLSRSVTSIKNAGVSINGKKIPVLTEQEKIFNKIDSVAANLSTALGGEKEYSVYSPRAPEDVQSQTISESHLEAAEPSAANSAVMMLASAGAAGDITDAVDFTGGQTRTINIDGVDYVVTNRLTTGQTFSYTKNASTGELTFISDSFIIKGQADVSHNIVIAGRSNIVYGGNLADTIKTVYNAQGNSIYGGKGDDNITLGLGGNSYVYGEDGNDTITDNAGGGYVIRGGQGDDIINLNSSSQNVYCGEGNDTVNVKGSYHYIFGEAGDDVFNIISGTTNLIDGGEGSNTAAGNISPNVVINAAGANAMGASFNGLETKVLTINGIDYTIRNNSSSINSLIYEVADDGKITFKRGSNFTITGDRNKAHNVVLGASTVTFYGGDLGDTIVSNNNWSTIYGNGGDDNISMMNNHGYNTMFGGDGNDIITLKGYNNRVFGDAGDDNISVTNNVSTYGFQYVDGGIGNDTFNIASAAKNTIVSGGTGANTITDNASNTLKSGFSDVIDNAETLNLATGETKTVTINGVDYTVKNNLGRENSLLYSYNAVTGEVTFGGTYVEIKSQRDVEHNIINYGFRSNITTGDLNDKITDYGYNNKIYAGAGDDELTMIAPNSDGNGEDGNDTFIQKSGTVHGGNGDDKITVSGGSGSYGELGNDTYIINGGSGVTDSGGDNVYYVNVNNKNVSGSMGNDTFYVSSNNNTIKGNGGNDYFVVDGENNTIDGGTGTNYFVDNSTGGTNNFTNTTVDPNSGMLLFNSAGETKTFTMNGKTYTVINQNADGSAPSTNQLQYSFNSNTGVITLNGSDFTITSDSDQSNLLNIRGDNNTINGSNLVDKITVEQGTNNIINGNNGNDILTSDTENNSLNGGSGNDTINLNVSTNKKVAGGDGNDIININSDNNININSGSGNDKVNINGLNNTVDVESGSNTVTTRGDNNTIKAGDGDNKLSTVGNNNVITAGNGNNTLGVQGDNNTITSQNALGDINIYGNSNDVIVTKGDNNIIIKGSGNTYTTMSGEKNVTVTGSNNEVNTGNGNDEFDIKGGSNTISSTGGDNDIKIKGDGNNYQGGAGIDSISINGDRNTASGGDADDSFMISKGNNNVIDGEAGDRNTMTNNGVNTIFSNVIDITPDPFKFEAKVGVSSSANTFISFEISFNLFDFSLDFSTTESSRENIDLIDELMAVITDQVTNIGSMKNRLESVLESQTVTINNLISSHSTIKDADIAKVSSDFIRNQILQSATASLMSQSSGIRRQSVLSLIANINS